MEKNCAILIGLAVAMLAAVPMARASMSHTTISIGKMEYTTTALWEPMVPPDDSQVRANVWDSIGGSSYDGYSGPAPDESFAFLEASFVDADVYSEGGSITAVANPEAGIDVWVNALIHQKELYFVVTQGGNLSLTLPYAYSVQTTTQNTGDWASAELSMVFAVTAGEDWLAVDSTGYSQSSSDGTFVPDQVFSGELEITTELQVDQVIRVWWTGEIPSGRAYTADVAPVPVPGAVLLGMLGLGYAGTKLRRLR